VVDGAAEIFEMRLITGAAAVVPKRRTDPTPPLPFARDALTGSGADRARIVTRLFVHRGTPRRRAPERTVPRTPASERLEAGEASALAAKRQYHGMSCTLLSAGVAMHPRSLPRHSGNSVEVLLNESASRDMGQPLHGRGLLAAE
jgi:hypothetical protein